MYYLTCIDRLSMNRNERIVSIELSRCEMRCGRVTGVNRLWVGLVTRQKFHSVRCTFRSTATYPDLLFVVMYSVNSC
jgi:hypothetical protein